MAVQLDDILSLTTDECTVLIRKLKGRSADAAMPRTCFSPFGLGKRPWLMLQRWLGMLSMQG
jgi:hypothetical protein